MNNVNIKKMQRRTHRVRVWLSDHEMDLLKKKVKQTGMLSVAGYTRKMALDGYIVNLDVSGIKEVVHLLRICSNNLNQYARRANETGCIYKTDIDYLRIQLEKIWEVAAGTLEALAAIS